jgi:hypothetical protein
MNQDFVKSLLGLPSAALVVRAMQERRAEILEGIEAGRIKADEAVMRELAELNVGIGDTGLEVGNE